ncbi:MAG TPA: hypothetical protein VF765_32715 [Polyangiaceae bacterium]
MRAGSAILLCFAVASCAELQNAVSTKALTDTAPEPNTPLSVPTETMTGAKGPASATYPSDYGVTVKSDGSIVFPQHTMGRIKGSALLVGNETVLTVSPSGVVKGSALKSTYHFTDTGELVDDAGNGVRISPDGGVRAMGGAWRHQDVMTFTPDGPGRWDQHAWRTLEVVALVVIENMLPQALHDSDSSASDAGKSKGLYIPPPSEWFK